MIRVISSREKHRKKFSKMVLNYSTKENRPLHFSYFKSTIFWPTALKRLPSYYLSKNAFRRRLLGIFSVKTTLSVCVSCMRMWTNSISQTRISSPPCGELISSYQTGAIDLSHCHTMSIVIWARKAQWIKPRGNLFQISMVVSIAKRPYLNFYATRELFLRRCLMRSPILLLVKMNFTGYESKFMTLGSAR